MGKRKLHAQTYFQCDWTGLPMRQTNCYMPDWNEQGKLMKHGSYCCWEAVMAHASEELLKLSDTGDGIIERGHKFKRIQEHVNDLVGCDVKVAPHWSKLGWFERPGVAQERTFASPQAFLDDCVIIQAPIMAVRIPAADGAHEVICDAVDIEGKWQKHLTKPFSTVENTPQSFQIVRKKANKDRDTTIFYWPFKNGLPLNTTASNAFKMQIYGDALVVHQSKEACFLPRERYVSYSLANFHELFNKGKRKEVSTLSPEEYTQTKAEMTSELQLLEATASANASLPSELAMAAVLPPPSGAELAALLRARGKTPAKRAKPSPSAKTSLVPVAVEC